MGRKKEIFTHDDVGDEAFSPATKGCYNIFFQMISTVRDVWWTTLER